MSLYVYGSATYNMIRVPCNGGQPVRTYCNIRFYFSEMIFGYALNVGFQQIANSLGDSSITYSFSSMNFYSSILTVLLHVFFRKSICFLKDIFIYGNIESKIRVAKGIMNCKMGVKICGEL